MKTKELRELTVDELHKKIESTRKELFEARFKNSLRQLEDTSSLKKMKQDVARLKTILAQKTAS